jgi:hypothetical protein
MAADEYKKLCDRLIERNLKSVATFLIKVINGTEKNEIFIKTDARRKPELGKDGNPKPIPPGIIIEKPIDIKDRLYAVDLFNRLVVLKIMPNEKKKPLESPGDGRTIDVGKELENLSEKLSNGGKDAEKRSGEEADNTKIS